MTYVTLLKFVMKTIHDSKPVAKTYPSRVCLGVATKFIQATVVSCQLNVLTVHEVFASLSASVAKLSFKNVWQVILYGKPHILFFWKTVFFHVENILSRAQHAQPDARTPPHHSVSKDTNSFSCGLFFILYLFFSSSDLCTFS